MSRDTEEWDGDGCGNEDALCQGERVYVEMHNIGEDVVRASQVHFGRGELVRSKYGQLDTLTRNVSNQ